MKILIIITGHRQCEEYKLYGLCLERCSNLSKICDIYIHCNSITNNFLDYIHFIKPPKKIYITEKNAGFLNGGIEAVYDIINTLNLKSLHCEYDYVIHMHPDVYIIDESYIINLLLQELNTDTIFYVNLSLNNNMLYSFDFFIFKPKKLSINIFENWESNISAPEQFLYNTLIENNIIHALSPRYNNNYYLPRQIDKMGLWHVHDIYRIYYYILLSEFNTIIASEYSIEYNIEKEILIDNTIWLEVGITYFYKFTTNTIYYYDYKYYDKNSSISTQNNKPILIEYFDDFILDKNISLLHIHYNSYKKTLNLLDKIKKCLINNTYIIINNVYNLIDGDFRALYEFLHKYNINYKWLGLNNQYAFLQLKIDKNN